MTTAARSETANDDLLRLVVDIPERGLVTIAAIGELDQATTPRFELTARHYLEGYLPYVLTLDLTGVRFFSCAGISAILRINDATTEVAATMHVVATDVVLRPLREFDLDRDLTTTCRRQPSIRARGGEGDDLTAAPAEPDWWKRSLPYPRALQLGLGAP